MNKDTITSLGKTFVRRALPGLFHHLQVRYGDFGVHDRIGPVLGVSDATVLTGPFTGMRYSAAENFHWFMLLGSYERELHGAVNDLVERGYTSVVNIGCADGYYAVGLALRRPECQVRAFDVLPAQQAQCRALAERNGVSDRVWVGGECDLATLGGLPLQGALIFCDCEGCELDLLRPDLVPDLAHCDLLVELHDLHRPGLTQELLPRFARTHDVQIINTVERDPADYPVLGPLSLSDRKFAMREGRVLPMQWAVLRRRDRSVGQAGVVG